MSGTDWNAAAYDDLSDPMFEWGKAVLSTVSPRPDERVLDAGCGSGRLTRELLAKVPQGTVVALDASPKMLEESRKNLAEFGSRVEFVEASLQDFHLPQPVDGIFSNAVFHWVPDHAEMFRSLYAALKPGGWLVAQFGGVGNLARFNARAYAIAEQPPFREFVANTRASHHFENADDTRRRMESAGFVVSEAKLHTVMPHFERRERFEAFIATVILRQVVALLPNEELRNGFLRAASEATLRDEGAYDFDYVRLTVRAYRPR